MLISNHIQKNEIYGTATPIPSANAAALDADGILLPSSDADANAAGRRTRIYYGHGYLTIVTKLNRRGSLVP